MLVKSSIVSAISVINDTQVAVSLIVNEKITGGPYVNQYKVCSFKLYKNSELYNSLTKLLGTDMKKWLSKFITVSLNRRGQHLHFVDIVDNIPGRVFTVSSTQDYVAYYQQSCKLIFSSLLHPNPNCGQAPGQEFYLNGRRV